MMKKTLALALLLLITGCEPYLHNGDRRRDRDESNRREERRDRNDRNDRNDRRDSEERRDRDDNRRQGPY